MQCTVHYKIEQMLLTFVQLRCFIKLLMKLYATGAWLTIPLSSKFNSGKLGFTNKSLKSSHFIFHFLLSSHLIMQPCSIWGMLGHAWQHLIKKVNSNVFLLWLSGCKHKINVIQGQHIPGPFLTTSSKKLVQIFSSSGYLSTSKKSLWSSDSIKWYI